MSIHIPITICLPVYQRPERTKRVLDNLKHQTISGFELIVVGDGCPHFQQLVKSPWWYTWKAGFEEKGNFLHFYNFKENMGAYGAYCIHYAVRHAQGRYFAFANNDDVLLPQHAAFYYESIKDSHADFVYNDTRVECGENVLNRRPQLSYGKIGHSEVVIKTSFLKPIMADKDFFNLYTQGYGHDWTLVQQMMKTGVYMRGKTKFATYIIKSTPVCRETGID